MYFPSQSNRERFMFEQSVSHEINYIRREIIIEFIFSQIKIKKYMKKLNHKIHKLSKAKFQHFSCAQQPRNSEDVKKNSSKQFF